MNKKWLIFTFVAIAQFMVVLDSSITNVALPAIKQSLHFSTNTLQWVITAYALTFGGFLLFGGRAADLFGRRKTLLLGMSGFTLISLFIGLSQSAFMIIALRALQGLAAAFMSPSALSIVLTTFSEGNDRNRALGFWTTIATGGAAVGLLLGGTLTQYLGWRWNFFINVPIGIFVITMLSRLLPIHEQEEVNRSHLDLPGAALVTASIISLVYVVSEGATWGWLSLQTVGLFILSLALLMGFILRESHTENPLIPLSIFKSRNVVGANLMMAPIFAGMFGNFFMISLYTQTVLHFDPVLTGLSFLPFPVILGIVSTRVAKLVSKYGYKRFLFIGPIIVAIAMAWFTRLPVQGNYFIDLLPGFILMPLGLGMTFTPIVLAATSGVPSNRAGLASGLINTSQQMGGALGLSILSTVAAAATVNNSSLDKMTATVIGYQHAFFIAVILIIFATVLGGFLIVEKKRLPKGSSNSSSATISTK
ncbi:MAG: MFS transporter [Candidatus Levyibacteriota bacterium]